MTVLYYRFTLMDFLVTLKSPVSALGRQALDMIRDLGRIFLFFLEGFALIFKLPFQFSKIMQQIYFIGMKSVFVICLTGAFTGMVLGLQGYYALLRVGSTGALGAAVALPLVREMGPVLTAIMVIARAGSAMAAERYVMVPHTQGTDPFWPGGEKGAKDAAAAIGAELEYNFAPSGDMMSLALMALSRAASSF